MSGFFLGFQARALSMALVCFGLAAVAPRGIQGFVGFLQAPPGLAVAALALMAIGHSVEETGTIRRIRFGIALRLLSVLILIAGVIWGFFLGSPMSSLMALGIGLCIVGGIGVAVALQHDWGTHADVRYGQSVRLVELSKAGLDLETRGERATLAISDLLGVRAVGNLEGRAVVFLVDHEARNRRDLAAIPWIGATPDGDAFALTEHQAGMDAEELEARIKVLVANRMAEAGR